jgi:hypothetical protein
LTLVKSICYTAATVTMYLLSGLRVISSLGG